jgi:hypothetical protein
MPPEAVCLRGASPTVDDRFSLIIYCVARDTDRHRFNSSLKIHHYTISSPFLELCIPGSDPFAIRLSLLQDINGKIPPLGTLPLRTSSGAGSTVLAIEEIWKHG